MIEVECVLEPGTEENDTEFEFVIADDPEHEDLVAEITYGDELVCYEYDSLNRVTRRWYNGSSSISSEIHNNPSLPSGVGATDENGEPIYEETEPEPIKTYTRAPKDKHPNTGVSLIPIVGSALESRAYYHEGRHGWAALYGVMAVSDVFLVKSIVTAPVKLGGKLLFKEAAEETNELVIKHALVESSVKLTDDALMVRGGMNLPESFSKRSGVTLDANGLLRGVSVNSAPGAQLKNYPQAFLITRLA